MSAGYHGQLYRALRERQFKPRDEGKVTYTKYDPFTVRLKIRNTHRYVPNVFIRVTTESKNIVCSDLVIESSERAIDADVTLYNRKTDYSRADNFLKYDPFAARLKIRNTHRYVPNACIRLTTDKVYPDLVMESSERTVDADMTFI